MQLFFHQLYCYDYLNKFGLTVIISSSNPRQSSFVVKPFNKNQGFWMNILDIDKSYLSDSYIWPLTPKMW